MALSIKIENLSKAYQLGSFSSGTLSKDIERWWALKRGKEDPFLKIGEENKRDTKSNSNIVWSLKDLSFDVEAGDAVGVLGKNGAGKSTLLKILSQVTGPTTGSIKMKGRVASLLEVGTGFHPELTGRENIFLNGAILGMKKREIEKNFDEIVDFSGVERYIDTPVKRYSSGMYVRLAFAVAAHLESEILIVDEVLAVGDFSFRKKCIGKMKDINSKRNKTLLFVSHDIASIRNLCNKSICLEYGKLKMSGNTDVVTQAYMNNFLENTSFISKLTKFEAKFPEIIEFQEFSLVHENGEYVTSPNLDRNEKYLVNIKFKLNSSDSRLKIGATIYNEEGLSLFYSDLNDTSDIDFGSKSTGGYTIDFVLPIEIFSWGKSYYIELNASMHHVGWILPPGNDTRIKFDCINNNFISAYDTDVRAGFLFKRINWNLNSY
jgi:lipopolysaccharide transport system ATP-binding protein